jgi:hypothetical protein
VAGLADKPMPNFLIDILQNDLNATFLQSLKAGVAAGDFVKVRASYKLSQDYKKKTVAAEKKAKRFKS